MGSGANGYCVDEYNSDNFDHTNLGFFDSGNIACNNTGARPVQSFGPLPPGAATWGSGWKAAVKFYYNRVVSFGMQGECLAYRQNYADLDPTYRDAWGNALIRITFNFTDNERKMVGYVAEKPLAPLIAQMNPALKRVADTITDFDSVPCLHRSIEAVARCSPQPPGSTSQKHCLGAQLAFGRRSGNGNESTRRVERGPARA